jgi:Ca2+-binding EF-hand superfamily protein
VKLSVLSAKRFQFVVKQFPRDDFEDSLNKMSEKDESSEEEGVDLDALITVHRDLLNNLKAKLRLWPI